MFRDGTSKIAYDEMENNSFKNERRFNLSNVLERSRRTEVQERSLDLREQVIGECGYYKIKEMKNLGCGSPLQCSCLGNPMGRGAWQATVHGVAKSQTR